VQCGLLPMATADETGEASGCSHTKEALMAGAILCGVTDSREGRDAAQLADALSARLGLRLVLAHVVDGIPVGAEESLTALQGREAANAC